MNTSDVQKQTTVGLQITRGFQIWSQNCRARSVAPAKVCRARQFIRRFNSTKWALFCTLRFTVLSAYDSLFDSEGIFERPGSQGLGKYGHCQIGYHRKKIDVFHPIFYSATKLKPSIFPTDTMKAL